MVAGCGNLGSRPTPSLTLREHDTPMWHFVPHHQGVMTTQKRCSWLGPCHCAALGAFALQSRHVQCPYSCPCRSVVLSSSGTALAHSSLHLAQASTKRTLLAVPQRSQPPFLSEQVQGRIGACAAAWLCLCLLATDDAPQLWQESSQLLPHWHKCAGCSRLRRLYWQPEEMLCAWQACIMPAGELGTHSGQTLAAPRCLQ